MPCRVLRLSPQPCKTALREAVALAHSCGSPHAFSATCPGRALPRYAWLRAAAANCRWRHVTLGSPQRWRVGKVSATMPFELPIRHLR
jgi:hypothetical protein